MLIAALQRWKIKNNQTSTVEHLKQQNINKKYEIEFPTEVNAFQTFKWPLLDLHNNPQIWILSKSVRKDMILNYKTLRLYYPEQVIRNTNSFDVKH